MVNIFFLTSKKLFFDAYMYRRILPLLHRVVRDQNVSVRATRETNTIFLFSSVRKKTKNDF